MRSQKGQALIESMIVLPSIMGFITLGLCFFHSSLCHYLIDSWVYQSSFCVAKEHDQSKCRSQLKALLNSIPFSKSQILSMNRTSSQSFVQVNSAIGILNPRLFSSKIDLPIKSQLFREAQ
ncbi:MAG: hypothetical protein AAF203_05090 [Pseudomonadota bacterium]